MQATNVRQKDVIMLNEHYKRERRMLQIAVFVAACIPVAAGAGGMVAGTSFFLNAGDASLDSHFRYLSGLLCGLGLSFWFMIPRIEQHTVTVRILTFLVVLGGSARLASAVWVAIPSLPMQLAIGMELVVTPLLCLWQTRIAKLAR